MGVTAALAAIARFFEMEQCGISKGLWNGHLGRHAGLLFGCVC